MRYVLAFLLLFVGSMAHASAAPPTVWFNYAPGEYEVRDPDGNTATVTIGNFFEPRAASEFETVEWFVVTTADITATSDSSVAAIGDNFVQIRALTTPGSTPLLILGRTGESYPLPNGDAASVDFFGAKSAVSSDGQAIATGAVAFEQGFEEFVVGFNLGGDPPRAFCKPFANRSLAFYDREMFQGMYYLGCIDRDEQLGPSRIDLHAFDGLGGDPDGVLMSAVPGQNTIDLRDDGSTAGEITGFGYHNALRAPPQLPDFDGNAVIALVSVDQVGECIATVSVEGRFADPPETPTGLCRFSLEPNPMGLTTAWIDSESLVFAPELTTSCSSDGRCLTHCTATDDGSVVTEGTCLLEVDFPITQTSDIRASMVFDTEATQTQLISNSDLLPKTPIPGEQIGLIPGVTYVPGTGLGFDQALFGVDLTTLETTRWITAGGEIPVEGSTSFTCQNIGSVSLAAGDAAMVECVRPTIDGTELFANTILIGQGPGPGLQADFGFSCTGRSCDFSDSSSGEIVKYHWDFDDNLISNEQNPTHVFLEDGLYIIQLEVTDADGNTDLKVRTVEISSNLAPQADFDADCSIDPLSCSFTNTTVDEDDPISSSWNFGDGSSTDELNPTHVYASAGPYEVTLTVTDSSGETDSITKTVEALAANRPPVAFFAPLCLPPPACHFFNGSSDPDGDDLTYLWNFGDGNSSTEEEPNHTYASLDVFEATLTVTDEFGATDSFTRVVDLVPHSMPPVAAFQADCTSGLICSFLNMSTDDVEFILFKWHFGDGESSRNVNPTHEYANVGTYVVRLEVTDVEGQTSEISTLVSVDGPVNYAILNFKIPKKWRVTRGSFTPAVRILNVSEFEGPRSLVLVGEGQFSGFSYRSEVQVFAPVKGGAVKIELPPVPSSDLSPLEEIRWTLTLFDADPDREERITEVRGIGRSR